MRKYYYRIIILCVILVFFIPHPARSLEKEPPSSFNHQHIYYKVNYFGNFTLKSFYDKYGFNKLSKGDNVSLYFISPAKGNLTYGFSNDMKGYKRNKKKEDKLYYNNLTFNVKENTFKFYYESDEKKVDYPFISPLNISWAPHLSSQFIKIKALNDSVQFELKFNIMIVGNVTEYKISFLSNSYSTLELLNFTGQSDSNTSKRYKIEITKKSPKIGEIIPYYFNIRYNSTIPIETLPISIEVESSDPLLENPLVEVNGSKIITYLSSSLYLKLPSIVFLDPEEGNPYYTNCCPRVYDIRYSFPENKDEGTLVVTLQNYTLQDISYVYGDNSTVTGLEIDKKENSIIWKFKVKRNSSNSAAVHLGIKSYAKIWNLTPELIREYDDRSKYSNFLKEEREIEVNHPIIQEISKNLTEESIYSQIASFYDYIILNFQYDMDKYDKIDREERVISGAKTLIEDQKGVCLDFANLFIALSRSKNIPAKQIIGTLIKEGNVTFIRGLKKNHAWSAINIPPYGWVEFEVTPTANPFGYLSSGHYHGAIDFEGEKAIVKRYYGDSYAPKNSSEILKDIFIDEIEEYSKSYTINKSRFYENINSSKFFETSFELMSIKESTDKINNPIKRIFFTSLIFFILVAFSIITLVVVLIKEYRC